ncbi:MAG: DUF998 domain-containing protein [Chloroflexi bacterium]|nr:DUF998 domain-containing protein [Chloroflexota bacterium]
MPFPQRARAHERILSAGLIVGPTAFISAWLLSGAVTPGYSPTRDHISDLAAIDAPTRTLMNAGFAAFAISVGAAAVPARRFLGEPAALVLGANALLTVGIMLAPLGRSEHGDVAHGALAGLGYLALAAMAPSAAPTIIKRRRRLGLASVGVGVASMACLGLSLIRPEAGFWQRAGITVTDAWLITMGLLAVTGADRGRA